MPPKTLEDMADEIATLRERMTNHEDWLKSVAADTKAIRRILDQAEGGMLVLRWIAGGSLAAFIAMLVMVYQYVSRTPGAH